MSGDTAEVTSALPLTDSEKKAAETEETIEDTEKKALENDALSTIPVQNLTQLL